jgi:hypothetical protein
MRTMKNTPEKTAEDLPNFVTLRAGVELGRKDGLPITMSRCRRDRAEGRLPPPDAALGNRHLWKRQTFAEYLRSLLRKPPPTPAPRPTRSAVGNDNGQPPAAA